MAHQLFCPINVGIDIALLLIAVGELSEGIVREAVLRNQLQQLSSLAEIRTPVVTVGKFHANLIGIVLFKSLLIETQSFVGVVLAHTTVAPL